MKKLSFIFALILTANTYSDGLNSYLMDVTTEYNLNTKNTKKYNGTIKKFIVPFLIYSNVFFVFNIFSNNSLLKSTLSVNSLLLNLSI